MDQEQFLAHGADRRALTVTFEGNNGWGIQPHPTIRGYHGKEQAKTLVGCYTIYRTTSEKDTWCSE